MKKIWFILLLLLFAAGCASIYRQTANAPESQAVAVTTSPRPTREQTATPVPTATIGHESTIAVMAATLDEARRVNAVITAEYEQRIMEQVRITAQHDAQVHEINKWTATAALTSIPLTATQQAALNTQAVEKQALAFAVMTATEHAPTQMVAIANAENSVRFAKANAIARLFGLGSVGVFLIGFVVFLFRIPLAVNGGRDDDKEEAENTIVWVEKNNGANSRRYDVPVSNAQLSELAEMAVNGERTFGINRLESSSRTLTRDALYSFRQFLLDNHFAFPPKPGEITLNDDGVTFLTGWFDNHTLPDGYEFTEGAGVRPAEMEGEAV